jgi:predicted nucleotidyltransferase
MIKAYASYFVSYVLYHLKNIQGISKIILFGSVAKDEATKDSDVDIFIELNKPDKRLEEEINKILDLFYKSREALLFKAKGIDNKINVIIGKLEEWEELKESIESTGIVLFGNYISSKTGGRKYAIISWDKIEKNRGAFLNKIYGFKVKDKSYKGLIENFEGKKIGKSTILVPIEKTEEIIKLAKLYKTNARIFEVYM